MWNLVRKELKVKYTASVLGAVWSLLNPVIFLAVFWFVSEVLLNGIAHYPVYLLSGLLAWNLLSVSLSTGAQSVIANANLVKKVYFPREILPLSTVGVSLVDFVLQSAVLLVYLVASGYGFRLSGLWLYPLAFVALLIFTTAVTFLVSALNVRYRDVQHLLGLGLLVWFWLTPIVYQGFLVQDKLTDVSLGPFTAWHAYLLNPAATIVFGFQRALYEDVSGDVVPALSSGELAGMLAIVIVASTVLLALTWRLYFSMSGDFAEEL
ncbi:MAG TPA: ABC transporter permease [Actinomycetota bacterium]|nr:ABC transporter permease [Actinomycetota bacterium]